MSAKTRFDSQVASPRWRGAWLGALALVLGCTRAAPEQLEAPGGSDASVEARAAEPAEPQGTAPSADTIAETELVSVRPHINDAYMEPGAVEKWTTKLERERREVIAERDAIVAALELAPGMVVADIGAGTGAFMQAISAELGAEGKLYAVDIAPQFLDHLRERAASEGLANVEVVEGSPSATNLPEGSVDLLFICDVYHHLEYPSVYLQSMYRSLRPGGRMVIIEFDKIPGKTSEAMMKHVRQDRPTLLAEVTAEGFVLEREIDHLKLDENYVLVFRK
ncbi:MAG: methyltransferase domain-containing protein [Enhygromyxa sp.]